MEYGYDHDYACMQRHFEHARFFVGEHAYVLLSVRVYSGSESCACACDVRVVRCVQPTV